MNRFLMSWDKNDNDNSGNYDGTQSLHYNSLNLIVFPLYGVKGWKEPCLHHKC